MYDIKLPCLVLLIAACGGRADTAADLGVTPDLVDPCRLDPGSCDACTIDQHCSVPGRPRCDPAAGTCVACLPANDNCASGHACRRVSGAWSCQASCLSGADCLKIGAGMTCCAGACVDLSADPAHCGACDRECAPVANGQGGCHGGGCIVRACAVGYADCDGQLVGGCEVHVDGDPLHCGRCGTVCPAGPNGEPACGGGVCRSSCRPGYSDCDGNATNGCETFTDGSASDCGGCGRACVAPSNARAVCDFGQCSFRCNLDFGDCNGKATDGCESDNRAQTNHCGHCGNVCPQRPNSIAPLCDRGRCGSECIEGFADCDGNPANGCEQNVASDLAHCGACGAVCGTNNARATCALGTCDLRCNTGFIDCNAVAKDGCEVNVKSDPAHCGGCDAACPPQTPACSEGVCTTRLRTVPGFAGEIGPDYTRDDWVQCVGVLDRPDQDDLPIMGWGNKCVDNQYTRLRVACGAGPNEVQYIDVGRNVLATRLNAYPENGLIDRASFNLGSNQIYATNNDPNNNTSWWVNGNGCNEASASITINNGCTWDVANCFGQNIGGQRYLYVYVHR